MTPPNDAANRAKKPLCLILGSGFSKAAKLPVTADITKEFLHFGDGGSVDNAITAIISNFWRDVFGYTVAPPSFEEHFTIIDLAANSGLNIGSFYTPKRLRAIRRISIHRIFEILDSSYEHSQEINTLLSKLKGRFHVSIVSLNWDVVVEGLLGPNGYDYSIPIYGIDSGKMLHPHENSVPLCKLHGSANWLYCDSCKRLFATTVYEGKGALHRFAYLEPDDFIAFESDPDLLREAASVVRDSKQPGDRRQCPHCAFSMTARLSTFSYRKFFAIPQFQASWERTHAFLSEAATWLFIGYSLPEADFEFMSTLKSAQLGRTEEKLQQWRAEVVLKDSPDAKERYERIFGFQDSDFSSKGLEHWVQNNLDEFIRKHG